MRRILVDNARRKQSQKRGGGRVRLDLDQLAAATSERTDDVLDSAAALAGLANADPQAAELVKLRYFVGLRIPQAESALGVSPRSADVVWAYARLAAPPPAWRRRLSVGQARSGCRCPIGGGGAPDRESGRAAWQPPTHLCE
jgi:hypothetical protein